MCVWFGVGNVLCAAKSTQELIVLIIAVRSSPGIIGKGMLPFLGFATQDWYRLERETDRHFLSVSCLLGTAITIVLLWAASRCVQSKYITIFRCSVLYSHDGGSMITHWVTFNTFTSALMQEDKLSFSTQTFIILEIVPMVCYFHSSNWDSRGARID